MTQPIDSVISLLPQSMYYLVESESITIEDALKHFHNNSKLLAIILTKSGSEKDKPIGIITGHDTMSMTKILEDY